MLTFALLFHVYYYVIDANILKYLPETVQTQVNQLFPRIEEMLNSQADEIERQIMACVRCNDFKEAEIKIRTFKTIGRIFGLGNWKNMEPLIKKVQRIVTSVL